MNLKKFINVAAISVLALAITACTEEPDTAFKKNQDLGYYDGMRVTWELAVRIKSIHFLLFN